MSVPSAVVTGACALHPEREAVFTCPRCGDNGCAECERRVVPTATPICPGCWSRREARVEKLQKDDGSVVCGAALAFGVLALIPLLWPAQLGALILAVVGFRRSAPGSRQRVYATIGGALAILGGIGTVVALVLMIGLSFS